MVSTQEAFPDAPLTPAGLGVLAGPEHLNSNYLLTGLSPLLCWELL